MEKKQEEERLLERIERRKRKRLVKKNGILRRARDGIREKFMESTKEVNRKAQTYLKSIMDFEDIRGGKILYLGQALPSHYYLLFLLEKRLERKGEGMREEYVRNVLLNLLDKEDVRRMKIGVSGELIDYLN